MRNTKEVVIKINEMGVALTETSDECQSSRTVSFEDLRHLFTKESFNTSDLLGGLIPCSSSGLIYAGRREDRDVIVYQAGPRIVDIAWHGMDGLEIIPHVPFPFLLFGFILNGTIMLNERVNRLHAMRVHAMTSEVRTGLEMLHGIEGYGNTSADGGICWGGNNVFVNNIHDVRGAVNAFYMTPFTPHLQGTREFVMECAGLDVFPVEKLSERTLRVDDFINSLIRGL